MEKTYQKLKAIFHHFSKPISLLTVGLVLFFANNSFAQMIILSDEETELYLQSLIRPIFQAAGIPFDRNKIYIVEDNSLNAFVSDGNNLFIHSETILKAKNSDELRGIIAHEAGHIQGGHILRHKLLMQEMQNVSLASLVVAGALGAASGRGDVAMGVALGAQSSLINQSLAYRVQEERNADEAAISLLRKTHHSPQGLLNFMKKIQAQNKLQGINENSYFRTHPLSGERIAFLQEAVKNSPYQPNSGSPDKQLKRIQAKLYAFVKSPAQTSLKYPLSDKSIDSQYARAIAAFKKMDFIKSFTITDKLIKYEPNNPHFHELKGQILMEQGKIQQAQAEFAQASKLLPYSVLFKINEAQAVLELSPSAVQLKNIIAQLQQASVARPTTIGWLLLAKAYGLNNQTAEAQYASAQFSVMTGDLALAKHQAEEAKRHSLSPQLTLKIDDLLNSLK
ncbi:MAG: M48 family metalloprotease [Alphaproteobacteria bacterium]|nr:M48 family metalloprotease [Alphaproteobacteria bacterium]